MGLWQLRLNAVFWASGSTHLIPFPNWKQMVPKKFRKSIIYYLYLNWSNILLPFKLEWRIELILWYTYVNAQFMLWCDDVSYAVMNSLGQALGSFSLGQATSGMRSWGPLFSLGQIWRNPFICLVFVCLLKLPRRVLETLWAIMAWNLCFCWSFIWTSMDFGQKSWNRDKVGIMTLYICELSLMWSIPFGS